MAFYVDVCTIYILIIYVKRKEHVVANLLTKIKSTIHEKITNPCFIYFLIIMDPIHSSACGRFHGRWSALVQPRQLFGVLPGQPLHRVYWSGHLPLLLRQVLLLAGQRGSSRPYQRHLHHGGGQREGGKV